MAQMRALMTLVAALIAVLAFACPTQALIEGPGVYYGMPLPEPFYNYWNYTSDFKDMHNLYQLNRFPSAADIYLNGRNNRRNATTMRIMHDFTFRNLTNEGPQSFWGLYTSHFKSMQYLKDLIDPPLFGNGSFARACCGARANALDVYLNLWLVAYAQHEVDVGIVLNAADEATHGFAIISSPVDERYNYWNRVQSYAAAACLAPVRDPITGNMYAASTIKYRDAFAEMEKAIAIEDEALRNSTITAVRAKLEREITIQFMQVMMVEAKKSAQLVVPRLNRCYKTCSKGAAFQSGAKAAWTAIQPLVARATDKSSTNIISRMLNTPITKPLQRKNYIRTLAAEVERLASSLGVNFRAEVYGCSWK